VGKNNHQRPGNRRILCPGSYDMKVKELVRPILAIIFSVAFCIFTGMGMIPIEAFIATASMIIVYYFGERAKEKEYERYAEYKRD